MAAIKLRWGDNECIYCSSSPVSGFLGVCGRCIKSHFDELLPHIDEVHRRARERFSLPPKQPKAKDGLACRICANECIIPEGGRGYCGLRENVGGRLIGATADKALVSWYYDPLPTNCVADWVCPGGTGSGYPEFAYRPGPEFGYKNLAVFFEACSFDCLFCQNWHFKMGRRGWASAEELASNVDRTTSCVCYFGGDPSPQLPYALRASRLMLKNKPSPILRICWETNGTMHPSLLRQAAELSLNWGGCIKFDIKSWSPQLNYALCGQSNQRTLENFRLLVQYSKKRREPPFLIASTLLVPGYIDAEEVGRIALFIAELDPEIPYTLLAFAPQFFMSDLPTTSRRQAYEALEEAKSRGLRRVRIGNIHLLS